MVGHDLHRLSEPDPGLEQQFSDPKAFIVLLMVFFHLNQNLSTKSTYILKKTITLHAGMTHFVNNKFRGQ